MKLWMEVFLFFLFISTLAVIIYLGWKLDSLESMLYHSVNQLSKSVINTSYNENKVGDEVYVHGYIDEIRKDVIIIRNSGGYFGTVREEVTEYIPAIIVDDILNEYGSVVVNNVIIDRE